jgi:hypothetical protein
MPFTPLFRHFSPCRFRFHDFADIFISYGFAFRLFSSLSRRFSFAAIDAAISFSRQRLGTRKIAAAFAAAPARGAMPQH